MLDDLDRRLLRYLQAEPDLTGAELSDRCGAASATCWRRVERMQEAGIIVAREAVIDWAVLGYEVEVSLRVTLDKTEPRAFDDFLSAARELPEVLAIQTFLGRVDVRLSVIARDIQDYQRVYRDHILALPHIADIESLMLISTVKHETAIPV
jgi:Lrp/AsnC family transcriptional regulator